MFLELFESGEKNKIDTSLLERVQSAIETADIEYIQDEIPSAIEQTLEGVFRVQKIVKAMKDFGHPGKSVHVQTNLNECIRNTVIITENEWKYVADSLLYEGHRGWINYLAVSPGQRKKGFGRQIMAAVESRIHEKGCPKINLQVRETNPDVMAFYNAIGYGNDHVISFGKRLEPEV